MGNTDALGDSRPLQQKFEVLSIAARTLYRAGCWSAPNVSDELAARLWTNLRDALSLPKGTATAMGVGDVRPLAKLKELLSELSGTKFPCDPTMNDPPCGECQALFDKIYAIVTDGEARAAALQFEAREGWAKAEALQQEHDDAHKCLSGNFAPTGDGIGRFTLSGRLNEYISHIREQLDTAEAALTEVRAELLQDNLTLRDQNRALGQRVKTAEAAIVSLQADLEYAHGLRRSPLRNLAEKQHAIVQLQDDLAREMQDCSVETQLADLQAQLQAITQEMRERIDGHLNKHDGIEVEEVINWADALDVAAKGQQ